MCEGCCGLFSKEYFNDLMKRVVDFYSGEYDFYVGRLKSSDYSVDFNSLSFSGFSVCLVMYEGKNCFFVFKNVKVVVDKFEVGGAVYRLPEDLVHRGCLYLGFYVSSVGGIIGVGAYKKRGGVFVPFDFFGFSSVEYDLDKCFSGISVYKGGFDFSGYKNFGVQDAFSCLLEYLSVVHCSDLCGNEYSGWKGRIRDYVVGYKNNVCGGD